MEPIRYQLVTYPGYKNAMVVLSIKNTLEHLEDVFEIVDSDVLLSVQLEGLTQSEIDAAL